MTDSFIFGVSGLDGLLSNALRRGSLVVLVGCPGSGKTILASTICYSNALRGSKCLYVSFFEDSEKFFSQMSNLGLDPHLLKSKGLLEFVKLPIMYSVEELYRILPKLINDFRPEVLVIDSVNALLTPMPGSERAVLQNTIYDMSKAINGLVVLTTEICDDMMGYGAGVGDVMYVADIVLVLGYRSEGGLISRMLEIKKVRGMSLTISELPFTIVGGVGFKVFVPPLFEELGGEGRELDLGCKVLRDALDHAHLGWSIYISYPPYTSLISALAIPLAIHVVNGLRGMIISYSYPHEVLNRLLVRMLVQYGLGRDEARELIRKHFVLKALNPYFYSISELMFRELELVDQYKSEINSVIFQGVEITGTIYPRNIFLRHLYNQLNYLKRMGLLTIRMGRYINAELHRLNASLADIFVGFKTVKDGELGLEAYLWRRGSKKPYLLRQDDLDTCCREVLQFP